MIKKCLSVVVSALIVASLCIMPAFASNGSVKQDARTYRVTLYAGNSGVFSDGSDAITWDVPFGGSVDFGARGITVTCPEKYYIKGVRLAADNSSKVAASMDASTESVNAPIPGGANNVTQDEDFVVTYGIKANRTAFTAKYVDANGNEIVSSDTYYGEIGDKVAPVAKYVEGYLPRENSQTLTLSGAADADNTIVFNYQKIADPNYVIRIIENNTVIILPGGEEVVITPTPIAEGEEAAPVTTPEGEVILADDGTPLATPIDEVDLDDNETPLADAGDGIVEGNQATGLAIESPLGWIIPALLACVVCSLAVFFALLLRNRRRDAQEANVATSNEDPNNWQ